ncbi:MAG TPA: DUF6600 domain-containing protein [Gemmatimonadaceae bacterium]
MASAQATEADDPPSRVARVSSLAGTVSLQTAAAPDWSLAALNYSMTTGDRVFTDLDSRAELEVGPFTVRVADSTDVTITDLTDGFAQFAVAQGTLRMSVYRMAPDDSIEVDTPNGSVTIRAPGHYRIFVAPTQDLTLLTVDDGAAEVDGPGLAQTLRNAQTVQLTGANPIEMASARTPAPTAFDAWSFQRDQRAVASGCGRYMSRDIPGCADLDQYGRWANTGAYGAVWYPPQGPPGWSPYRYGHWGWVEPWGWVWVEAEPWGFAPFHYGRWVMVSGAWGWIPGPVIARPFYSPALVVFVGGGGVGGGVQAWFPLGPREPFVPWYHYGPRYLRTVNAANVRGVTNIDVFVSVTNRERVRYVNRSSGFTAVSSETFRTGHRVDGAVVRVRGSDIGSARVLPHPTVMPTVQIAAGGPPAPRPPVMRRPSPVRPTTPNSEPTRTATPRTATSRPPMITRRPPPPPTPSFSEREKALQANPGRPLDPQQVRNLQRGKPAGPPHEAPPPSKKPDDRKAQPRKPGGGGGG